MRILLTGATGLVGSKLSEICRESGIEVFYLTTSKSKIKDEKGYKGFYWNPKTEEIDKHCLDGVQTIVHLAGANIAEPWTKSYKRQIINSRVETADLLYKTLKEGNNEVEHFVSASAIGVYPSSRQKLYSENDQAVAQNFVGTVVEKWESAADQFSDLGLKIAKVRIGLVLAENGGMLEKIKKPIKLNMGAALGSGKQWQSWIHQDDLAGIFLKVIEDELEGVYNGVAPNPVTNEELTKELAKKMGKSVWLPNVPEFALKVMLGEMSQIVLSSQLVSSEKIQGEGYQFKFNNLGQALNNLT